MNFEGDILLKSTNDGGDLSAENNFIQGTGGFETAVYLSLMGGNVGDDGTESTKLKSWWGNQLDTNEPDKKMISRLQNIIRGLPATPANLNKAIQAAKDDLAWFKSQGIADTIKISGSIPTKNMLQLEIQILKNGELLTNNKFELNWLAQSGK